MVDRWLWGTKPTLPAALATRRVSEVHAFHARCDASGRIGDDPVVVNGKIQHLTNDSEQAIRGDRRPFGDAFDQRSDVASGEFAHGPIAPAGEDFDVQHSLILAATALELPRVLREVVLDQRLDSVRPDCLGGLTLSGRIAPVVDRAVCRASPLPRFCERDIQREDARTASKTTAHDGLASGRSAAQSPAARMAAIPEVD